MGPGLLYYPSATRERKISAPEESGDSSIKFGPVVSVFNVKWKGLKHDVVE